MSISPKWPRLDDQGAHCFTSAGRAAIFHGLRALGIGVGDGVLVPTYHCPTMIEPCIRLGCHAVFYPIGAGGEPQLAHLQNLDTSSVKALLAAHLFGLPQDLRPVRDFCSERGIALIEDCAHAYFGMSAAGPLGSLGDVAIGSLPKSFPVVEGGCLVMRGPTLTLPRLRGPGAVRQLRVAWDALELGAAAGRLGRANSAVSSLSRWKQRLRGGTPPAAPSSTPEAETEAALNTMNDPGTWQAASGVARWLVKRVNVERLATRRRANYALFSRLLSGCEHLRPLLPELPDGAVPYVFPLEVDAPDALYPVLRERGVPLYRWDILWPGTPQLAGDAGARWARHVLQLACHEDMSSQDVEAVASTVLKASRRVHR